MIDFCVPDIIRKQLDSIWKKVAMSAAEPEMVVSSSSVSSMHDDCSLL